MTPSVFATAFALSSVGLGVSVAISTLEYLGLLPAFDSNGAFSWRILGTRSAPSKFAVIRRLVDALMCRRGVALILVIRLACVLALAAGLIAKTEALSAPALGGILATGMFINYRCPFGMDGADQMANIVSAGLLAAALPSNTTRLAGFGFIAFQSCLSYGTAGIAKAISPVWRSGTALHKIMNAGMYGNAWLADVLRRNRVVGALLCWFVIVFEGTFPLIIFLPFKLMLAVFTVGCMFHVGIAIFMGLNTFLWSFVATYPAIWVCGQCIRRLMA
jgi:hypothetical protein